jgi:hypothetical protein
VAAADTLLKAKLALCVGNTIQVSATESIVTADEATILAGSAPTVFSSNLTLEFVRATIVNGKLVVRNVEVLDALNSFGMVGTKRGRADITKPALLAYAAAFYDSEGHNDYSLRSGRYQIKFSRRGNAFSRRNGGS